MAFVHPPRCISPVRVADALRRTAAISFASFIAFAAVASVDGHASEALARDKGCLSCHAVQTKVVGPAYKDVAAKYAGQPDAEDKLVQKVLKGGGGNWGFVPMPPNTNVSDDEARVLVKWILSNP